MLEYLSIPFLSANASDIASKISALLTVYKIPCEAKIAVFKAMVTEWLGALKGFYNYKAAKEAFEFDGEDMAMFESKAEDAEEDVVGDEGSDDKKEEGTTESVVAGILEQAQAFL